MSQRKVLAVCYFPRGEASATRTLYGAFRAATGSAAIEEIDLTRDPPLLFMPDSVRAYFEGHHAGAVLGPEPARALEPFRRLARQLAAADDVVLATPMYNFSLPATVKAWFDAVMLKGVTWGSRAGGIQGPDGRAASPNPHDLRRPVRRADGRLGPRHEPGPTGIPVHGLLRGPPGGSQDGGCLVRCLIELRRLDEPRRPARLPQRPVSASCRLTAARTGRFPHEIL